MQDIKVKITDRDGVLHEVDAPTDMNMNLMELVRSYELAPEGTIGVCGGMAMLTVPAKTLVGTARPSRRPFDRFRDWADRVRGFDETIPHYLRWYWWAYTSPWAIRFWDVRVFGSYPLINAVLFGNYGELTGKTIDLCKSSEQERKTLHLSSLYGGMVAWLIRIARNAHADARRQQHRRGTEVASDAAEPAIDPSDDDFLRRGVLACYAARDVAAARQVWADDDEIDTAYGALFRELIAAMIEDQRTIGLCTHLLFCAKNIERVGDHVTNIAETVHYLVTGQPLEEHAGVPVV